RAAGKQLSVPHGGLEGRADPFVQGIGRLNVVVAVDEQSGTPGHLGALRPYDGMAVTLDDLDRRATQAGQPVTKPHPGAPAPEGVSGESTHTGNTKKLAKLFEQAILLTMGGAGIHGTKGTPNQRHREGQG